MGERDNFTQLRIKLYKWCIQQLARSRSIICFVELIRDDNRVYTVVISHSNYSNAENLERNCTLDTVSTILAAKSHRRLHSRLTAGTWRNPVQKQLNGLVVCGWACYDLFSTAFGSPMAYVLPTRALRMHYAG